MKMTSVALQPGLATAKVITIVKADTRVDGDVFEFANEWEAAHFCRVFTGSHAVLPVGEWTQRVVAMPDMDMNDLL